MDAEQQGADARALIEHIVAECPGRTAGSPSERRAQEILGGALEDAGLALDWHSFRAPGNLYLYLAVEAGLAVLGSALVLVSPWIGLALHLGSAASLLGHATRRWSLTARLLPHRSSQNLLATRSGAGEIRRRVVVLAHADAAYTGWVFHPRVLAQGAGGAVRSMVLAWGSVVGLAVVDVVALVHGEVSWWVVAALVVLSLPSLLALVLTSQVVARDEVVPGANDDLSGCAAAVLLARRLSDELPEGAELVVAITGAEEAGTRGAGALARDDPAGWAGRSTAYLALDGLGGGAPRLIQEGEILPLRWPQELGELALGVAASDPRFGDVTRLLIPAGASDAVEFTARGEQALGLVCLGAEDDVPTHYHSPTDTPDNVDTKLLVRCVDYAEAVIRAWWAHPDR